MEEQSKAAYHLHTEADNHNNNGGGVVRACPSGDIPMQTLATAPLSPLELEARAAPAPSPSPASALSPSSHISALTSHSLSPPPGVGGGGGGGGLVSQMRMKYQQQAGGGGGAMAAELEGEGGGGQVTSPSNNTANLMSQNNPCLVIPTTTANTTGENHNNHLNLNLINLAKSKRRKRNKQKRNNFKHPNNNNNNGNGANTDSITLEESGIVVIAKSYYVSHSLRYPPLLQSGKPIELEHLSSTTWFEIQTQLEPLLNKHLFLPKSYVLVPFLCLVASLSWLTIYSIANAAFGFNSSDNNGEHNFDDDDDNYNYNYNDDDANGQEAYQYNYGGNYNNYNNAAQQYNSNSNSNNNDNNNTNTSHVIVTTVWMMLFFGLLATSWWVVSKFVNKRNQPVDEELREVCMELSRYKTQSEGYRLEYHKTGSNTLHQYDQNDIICNPQGGGVFATRVLRFVPLPIPRKISVPNKNNTATATTNAAATTTTTTTSSKDAGVTGDPGKLDIELQKQQQGNTTTTTTGNNDFGVGIVQRQASYLSAASENSDYPTLQSLSYSLDFAPFPKSDVLMENLLCLLFVSVIVQFVHSLPHH